MLSVGIPKEVKPFEQRVGLTPEGVKQLTAAGILVYLEADAGDNSGFLDKQYQEAGAIVCKTAKELFKKSDLIQKVKEPYPSEYAYLKQKKLFCFLHLASQAQCELLTTLCSEKTTAIAYETIVVDKKTPVLAPMSKIAGGLSSLYGAYVFKHGVNEGQESLRQAFQDLGQDYPKVPGAWLDNQSVLIWGGGIAGEQAAKVAANMGARVVLVEKSEQRREDLKAVFSRIANRLCILDPEDKEKLINELHQAKIWVGCVHTPGHRAMQLLSSEELRDITRSSRKIICDISIDQGGNFPGSKTATYENPIYEDAVGNQRFSVANIPSFCGRLASEEITRATVQYTQALAQDWEQAFIQYPELANAVNIRDGEICLEAIKQVHQR